MCWGFAPSSPWRRPQLPQSSFAAAAGFGGGGSVSPRKKTKKSKKQQAASSSSSISNTNKKIRAVRSGHAAAGSKVLRQSALAFDRLRKNNKAADVVRGGDVYIRSPLHSPTTFWYVGKVAFEGTGVSANTACIAHKSLIFEYAKQELRPQNFGGKYAAALELWLAPPDSEMDVVRNVVDLVKVQGSVKDLPDDFDVKCVGWNPEIYVGDERAKGGLRVERDEEGKPTKEVFDVNESA